MALGLSLLYHAGPWFWMSRTLTLIGCALPLAILAAALWRAMPSSVPAALAVLALETVLVLAAVVLVVNVSVSGEVAYRVYALCNMLSQAALCLTWAAWLAVAWRSVLAWLGLAGAIVGALGFGVNAHLRFVGPVLGPPAYIPPEPWCSTRSGDCGPVDMLSRVLPDLVLPEAMLLALFAGLWVVWGLRPRLVER